MTSVQSIPSPMLSPAEQRKVYGLLPTSVVAISGVTAESTPTGFIVGTFQSLSLEPALVTFSIAKTSSTWPILRSQGRFTANVLSNRQLDVCKALGRKGEEKFKGLDFDQTAFGTPHLRNAVAWIDCTVLSEVVAGDHFMIVGSVNAMKVGSGDALIFSGGRFGDCNLWDPTEQQASATCEPSLLNRISDAWSRAWGEGDTGAFEALVAPDYVRHSKQGEMVRLPEMLLQIQESHAAFSDFKVEILHATEEEGLISLHWRTIAKHTGVFMDVPPTQRNVTVHGASFIRHRNGRITEEWVVWDPRELLSSMHIWHLGNHKVA
ncbi:flavin reductase [Pseudomonas vanderleydeniana]|uniref:Flavin reductase n=1 Tax=Pseudomonas vanderleydeniana TaxID=2745495 RepID=A0A9E6PPU6_9PSED|nr:flavin reductase [Pseudomonas vanderleydeniana]QXI30575.1 flavin reductase [Pseudomonas vanderleydeniana]